MKTIFLIFLFSYSVFANEGSLFLVNDSPFVLTATVEASDGTSLSKVTIMPGQQMNWGTEFMAESLQIPGAPDVSLTPYRVVWRCKYGGFYSMCSDVAPGSLISSNTCPGARYCRPKPKKEKQPECPACICPSCEQPSPKQEKSSKQK